MGAPLGLKRRPQWEEDARPPRCARMRPEAQVAGLFALPPKLVVGLAERG